MTTDPGDAPVVKIYRIERRRARITHKCYSCLNPILPGQSYDRHFSVDDCEGVFVWKQHAFPCNEDTDYDD